MPRRRKPPSPTPPTLQPTLPTDLRECILADFTTLKVPLRPEQLEAVLARLDRIVDGAIILTINGKSYRAHRTRAPNPSANAKR